LVMLAFVFDEGFQCVSGRRRHWKGIPVSRRVCGRFVGLLGLAWLGREICPRSEPTAPHYDSTAQRKGKEWPP